MTQDRDDDKGEELSGKEVQVPEDGDRGKETEEEEDEEEEEVFKEGTAGGAGDLNEAAETQDGDEKGALQAEGTESRDAAGEVESGKEGGGKDELIAENDGQNREFKPAPDDAKNDKSETLSTGGAWDSSFSD